MALHEQSLGATDEWYTAPYVFEKLGCEFDTDVASPGQHITDWIPAKRFITRDTLSISWTSFGYVWANFPFGGRNGSR